VIGGRNGFNGPTPDDAWNPEAGHYGALEIAARYSAIEFASITFPDFADPAASARRASNFGAALTWVLSRMAQIGVNLEHTEFRGASKTGNRKAENLLLSRAQLNF
jgi:phosphate-selective porin OprO/OprP